MGKTYEAYLKYKSTIEKDAFIPTQFNDWQCPNLLDTDAIAELAQRVTIDSQKEDHKVLNFVSCRSGEGTSTIIVNLAMFLSKAESQSQKNILLIDASSKHPVLHLAFNTSIGPGLNELLTQKAKISDVIYKIENSKIHILPKGRTSDLDYSKIEPKIIQNYLSDLKQNYSCILIDSSPLLTSSGSLLFSISADSIFLVVQAHMTQWEVVEKTKTVLSDYDCQIDGVILNKIKQVIPDWLYKRL